MNILITAATAMEIAPFLAHYRKAADQLWRNAHMDILITGVGMMPAVYHLTRQLSMHRPQLVLQAGVAGSFSDELLPGNVALVKTDTVADMMVWEQKKYRSVFDMGLIKKNSYPFEKGRLPNTTPLLRELKLKKVSAITVNEITTGKKKVDYYRETYQPDIESMEGAALHYVCRMENIPFLQLRSISNKVGERNKKKWDMQAAVHNLNKAMIEMVDQWMSKANK